MARRKGFAKLPAQIKRSSESLAIENFFANWVAYPTDLSPGYLHHLPSLYQKTAYNSVLALAVRAVAFADMKRLNNGNQEYELKGLQNYAAAITRLRTVVKEATDFEDDQILAVLLLIDAFEVRWCRFCLARVAIFRLQSGQLFLGEDCGELQQHLLDSINQDRPDLRAMYHVSQIIHLCA